MPFTLENKGNITQLLHTAFRKQLYHPQPDAVLSIETHLFNVSLHAVSCEYNLDIGRELWLNRTRWSRLTREYIDRDKLEVFLEGSRSILSGGARDGACCNMQFRDPPRRTKKHRWGGCLMGATFRGANTIKTGRATLTFFSRTTYMGYMGMLDACIANVLAREIAGDPAQVEFRWNISSMQLHSFKSLPFITTQRDLMDELDAGDSMTPTWKVIRSWYKRVLAAYEEHGSAMLDFEKYGPFKRIKRRWMEYKGYLSKNIPPSLKPNELDFSKADVSDGNDGDDEEEEGEDE